ncbi:uncharacterized protein C17orf113-like [Ptychodera flava]|uniref:uncharacterized protein C17orf113-like n=1 Tax=Ptychodera flava TaxID=63121 RepID=UPI003969BCC1
MHRFLTVVPRKSTDEATSMPRSSTPVSSNGDVGKNGKRVFSCVDQDSSTPTKPAAKKVNRHENFLPQWLSVFPWLEYTNGAMFCKWCKTEKKKNKFTVDGCKNFQKSALSRHQSHQDHSDVLLARAGRKGFQRATAAATEKSSDSLQTQMKCVYWLAKEELPASKFESLVGFLKETGCPSLTAVPSDKLYSHHSSVEDMEEAIAEVIDSEIDRDIQNSGVYGIMVDESVDIAVHKVMSIVIRIVVGGEAKNCFLGNVEVHDGKAETITNAVCDFLTARNIPLEYFVGFGSDGAAVMTGRLNGVAARLRRDVNSSLVSVHCAAHRLSLASSQAAKSIESLKKYQQVLNNLYMFFNSSPVRYNKLREIQSVLDEVQVALQQPTPVRWLSVSHAVQAVHRCWDSLVTTLETIYSECNNSVAKGLLSEITSYSFVSITALLMDVLPVVSNLSKVFQREHVDWSVIKPKLQIAISLLQDMSKTPALMRHLSQFKLECNEFMYKGRELRAAGRNFDIDKLCDTYIESLVCNLSDRFPQNDMDILQCFDAVFNPRCVPLETSQLCSYADKEFEKIVTHFSSMVDKDRATDCFIEYKYLLHCHRSLSFQQFCRLLLCQHQDDFPDFCKLASIALVIPLSSVPCERAFSCQNRIKTKLRNRLTPAHLSTLMKISLEGKERSEFNFLQAVSNFNEQKARRKFAL